MRGCVACLGTAVLLNIVAGCSAANSLLGGNTRKDAVAEIAWEYAQNAVMVELEADPKLNQYGGEAHTLVLGVYQMEDSAAFYKLVADPLLVGKTLETGKGGEGFGERSAHGLLLGFGRCGDAQG